LHGPQQIADGVGRRQEVLREMDAAGALQAREEFRAPQAVQAQVTLQRTVQGGGHGALVLRMQLAHDLLDRIEHHDRIGVHRLWLR
jgi:hypothetical protein